MTHGSIPPAVGDAAVLDDVYRGDPDPFIRAGRSSKRRKTAETLHGNDDVTEPELGTQEVLHLQQATSALPAGAAIPGSPAWFGPAVAAAMAPVMEHLNNIDGQLNNIEARQANVTVQAQADALHPIRKLAGKFSPHFPATLGHPNTRTNPQQEQLVQFYGRGRNPLATRDHRLKQVFGSCVVF